ncbi:hypothetical protein I215_07706 [Galbibacter marinus]|uniref:DUF4159 domain-containing protein n=1 Tax=Galbibacter marinus TaxID=555500 RepID=K2PV38_9FLAO|nr:DUF4159 domain-containing protein [Galbibacter marinus]EKF55334.1 hypothetical protein I215_07706 [Galbibacter marinus]
MINQIKRIILLSFFAFSVIQLNAQQIAVLKYQGGGDWYANPTALPNLITFCNTEIGSSIESKPATVEPSSSDIFQYPFIHMTGHGNVFFSPQEAKNLQQYLLSGGFLHIDDNYGMYDYFKKELPKIFPDKQFVELPTTHPIFQDPFDFPDGLPKIHEHDGKRPQAFGVYDNNRLVLLFTFESDLGDGWENQQVHNDPEEVRLNALRMGANIISYVFKN